MNDGERLDYYDENTGEHMAACLSCDCFRPIRYGYSEHVTGGAAINLGGPISAVRLNTETREKTFCAVCGHRVFTTEEYQSLVAQDAQNKANWQAILIFGIVVVGLLVLMIVSAS